VIYDRFSRGSRRGLWAKILMKLPAEEGIIFNGRRSTKYDRLPNEAAILILKIMINWRYGSGHHKAAARQFAESRG
jgi:hypothetical protein